MLDEHILTCLLHSRTNLCWHQSLGITSSSSSKQRKQVCVSSHSCQPHICRWKSFHIIPYNNCRSKLSAYLSEKSHMASINHHIPVTPLLDLWPQPPHWHTHTHTTSYHRVVCCDECWDHPILRCTCNVVHCAHSLYCYTRLISNIREDASNQNVVRWLLWRRY